MQVVAIATGSDVLVQATKPLLMPALAITVLLARLGSRFTVGVGLLLLAIGLLLTALAPDRTEPSPRAASRARAV